MGFGNPVPGTILENKAPWPGPPTFRVTSTFAQHVASGRGAGIDIGNQRCGAPVLAMADGTVTFVGQLSTAIGMANVVRYRVSATEEFGAAHLATMAVVKGQLIKRGQQIGTLGMTGADACHLHQGYKVNGVEKDWWPLLDQNGDDVLNPALYSPVATCTVNPGGTLYGDENRTTILANPWPAAPVTVGLYAITPPATSGKQPLVPIRINMKKAPAEDFRVGWVGRDKVTNLSSGGYTQAELDAAVDKAEADAGFRAATDVAAASVTQAKKYGGT